ncbi:hypothetical protein ABT001_16280 [Streptomyces sp. NPDC002793]|uniref:hypothetical protein n=1 Tax=Streptomyces sp. NPDC002793 TaxID=3154432 RepID=UPI0033327D21
MLALGRADELQASRNDYFMADVKGTTAVIGVFNSKTKAFTTRIGINGGGAMPSGWTLRPVEEFVQAAGHAEQGILSSLGPNEHAVFGAASRNFCVAICSPMLNVRGGDSGWCRATWSRCTELAIHDLLGHWRLERHDDFAGTTGNFERFGL